MGPLLSDPQAARLAQLMDVSSLRARVHAANLANQNTPGYKAREVAFDEAFRQALESGEDTSDIEPVIQEQAGLRADNDGNTVSTERETLGQAQNMTLYNTYLAMMQGKKKLLTTALTTSP
jgi:flagellar basal-body rod protein FlgB